MPPLRCCSSVKAMLKSALKSLPDEDTHGNVHPIRPLYAWSFASGAREMAVNATSWFCRWTAMPLNPSAIAEQEVIHDELRAPAEEICQRGTAFLGLETVCFVDPDPRQLLPPPRQLVAAPREVLLRLEQLEPRCEPLFTCSGIVSGHRCFLRWAPSSPHRSRHDVPAGGREMN